MPISTAVTSSRLIGTLLPAAVLLLVSSASAAAASAGQVMMLTGRATATDATVNSIRDLSKGDPVHGGEIINSGINSYLNLKFTDGSYILLRPGTRFVIEAFEDASAKQAAASPPVSAPAVAPAPPATAPAQAVPAKPAPRKAPPVASAPPATAPIVADSAESSGTSRAFFRLLKGGFRAVSGLIGKADPSEYLISTPVATIGIRGTDYIVVVCDAACAADPVLREELPANVSAEGGLVANIVTGSIRLDTIKRQKALSSPVGWLGVGMLLAQADGIYPDEVPIDDSSITIPAKVKGKTINNVVIGPDGKIYPLTQLPKFLVDQPIPDPTTLCE